MRQRCELHFRLYWVTPVERRVEYSEEQSFLSYVKESSEYSVADTRALIEEAREKYSQAWRLGFQMHKFYGLE
jgi:hypothetical protein